MKDWAELTEVEEFRLRGRMDSLRLAACRYALHPHDSKVEMYLMVAAREFSVACDEAGLKECFREILVSSEDNVCRPD